jgi:4-aminobutyrate aminotransferase-like enzyme
MEREQILARARQVGEITRTALLAMQQRYPLIADVRGLGALIGVELRTPDGQPAKDLTSMLVTSARDEGLLLLAGGTHGNVLRMLAPLTVELRTLEAGLRILDRCFSTLCRPEPGRHD